MLLFAKYEYNRLIIKRQNIEIDSLEVFEHGFTIILSFKLNP